MQIAWGYFWCFWQRTGRARKRSDKPTCIEKEKRKQFIEGNANAVAQRFDEWMWRTRWGPDPEQVSVCLSVSPSACLSACPLVRLFGCLSVDCDLLWVETCRDLWIDNGNYPGLLIRRETLEAARLALYLHSIIKIGKSQEIQFLYNIWSSSHSSISQLRL